MSDEEKQQETLFRAEFDDYEGGTGLIEIIQPAEGTSLSIWATTNSGKILILEAVRDQWGVFVSVSGVDGSDNDPIGLCVAQEDNTRSFMDALDMAIVRIRKMCEMAKPADVLVDRVGEKETAAKKSEIDAYREQIALLRQALALHHSMVLGGEKESAESEARYSAAMDLSAPDEVE